MDEKIAEGEKMIEQLTADKKALQTALANDSDQRNQVRLRFRISGGATVRRWRVPGPDEQVWCQRAP